jgi:hypothetical protein
VRGGVEGGWGGGGGRGRKKAFEEVCQGEGGEEREGGCEIREMFAALDVRGQGFLTSQSLQEVFCFCFCFCLRRPYTPHKTYSAT